MLRNLLIAIAIVGGLASVALCGNFGWDQGGGVLKDQLTQAFIYGMVAVFTLVLHVAAIRAWILGWHKVGLAIGVAGFLAFVMTAFTSLGGLASRSDKVIAERQDVLDSKADTKGQIEALVKERVALQFKRTTKATVDAAQLAVDAAASARKAECGNGEPVQRGKFCRGKEDGEAAAIKKLTEAQENKAATDRFEQIENELRRLRSLKGDTGVGSANPLRDLLATIMGTWADLLTSWQKAAFAVVYDVCMIATMISIEVLGHVPPSVAARARSPAPAPAEPEPARIEPPPRPRLVVSGGGRPTGSIPKILSAALEPAEGSRVEMAEIYAAYAGECARQCSLAVRPKEFVDPLQHFCSTCRIKTKILGGKVYLLNVRLALPLPATRVERSCAGAA